MFRPQKMSSTTMVFMCNDPEGHLKLLFDQVCALINENNKNLNCEIVFSMKNQNDKMPEEKSSQSPVVESKHPRKYFVLLHSPQQKN